MLVFIVILSVTKLSCVYSASILSLCILVEYDNRDFALKFAFVANNFVYTVEAKWTLVGSNAGIQIQRIFNMYSNGHGVLLGPAHPW